MKVGGAKRGPQPRLSIELLNPLRERGFQFIYDPASGIESVALIFRKNKNNFSLAKYL